MTLHSKYTKTLTYKVYTPRPSRHNKYEEKLVDLEDNMLKMFDHFLSLDPPLRLIERFPNAINEITDEITRDLKPEADKLILDAVTSCVKRFSKEVADVENWSTTMDRLGDGIKVTVVTNERLNKLQEDLSRILLRYNAAMLRKLRARVRQMVERADLIEICAKQRYDVMDRQQVVERATEGVFELIGVRTQEAKAAFASSKHTLGENERLYAAGSPDAMGRDGFSTFLAALMAQEEAAKVPRHHQQYFIQKKTALNMKLNTYSFKSPPTNIYSFNPPPHTLSPHLRVMRTCRPGAACVGAQARQRKQICCAGKSGL